MTVRGAVVTSRALPDSPSLVPATRAPWRDLLLCLSWANIALSRVWSEVLTYSAASSFHMKQPPGASDVVAVMASVLALTLGSWIVVRSLRKSRVGLAVLQVIALLAWLIPLNAIRLVASTAVPGLFNYIRQPLLGRVHPYILIAFLAAGAVGLIGGIAALRAHRSGAASALCSIALPLVLVTWGQGFYRIVNPPSAIPVPPLAGPLATTNPSHRVIWIIFDEWDYRLSFSERPSSLALPTLDRLRANAIFMSNAHPPAPDTAPSLSSMLTMRRVISLEPMEHSTALLMPGRDDIGKADNVFRHARALGMDVAVVGWYLPYCRIFGGSLTACDWWETDALRISHGSTLYERSLSQLRSTVETGVLSPFGQSMATQQSAATYQAMLNAMIDRAVDPSLDFVFVHMPIPHSPFFYDRHSGTFTGKNSYVTGYLDHLALVDRSLGQVWEAMQHAGSWEGTTVILSADHHFRNATALDGRSDPRVPLLIKLAHQNQATHVEQPVDTIHTAEVVLRALKGELSSASDVLDALEVAPR